MKKAKQKKLKSAGWKVSDPKELLGLSAEDALLIEIKLALAAAVKRERNRRQWTQAHAAQFLGSSQSRLAKMEAGDCSVSIDLLVSSLVRMGATRNALARALRSSAA